MIKAIISRADGAKGLFIGLSMRNVTMLQAGKPIAFTMDEVGSPDIEFVVIHGGETEQDIIDDLKVNGVALVDETGEEMN